MTQYFFAVTPIGKPRATQRDKWAPSEAVVRYRGYADDLRFRAKLQRFVMPEAGAAVTFYMPMPESWSMKKKAAMFGKPHQQKPDIDNLLKAMMDALLPDGDERVHHLRELRKVWAVLPGIQVEVIT